MAETYHLEFKAINPGYQLNDSKSRYRENYVTALRKKNGPFSVAQFSAVESSAKYILQTANNLTSSQLSDVNLQALYRKIETYLNFAWWAEKKSGEFLPYTTYLKTFKKYVNKRQVDQENDNSVLFSDGVYEKLPVKKSDGSEKIGRAHV